MPPSFLGNAITLVPFSLGTGTIASTRFSLHLAYFCTGLLGQRVNFVAAKKSGEATPLRFIILRAPLCRLRPSQNPSLMTGGCPACGFTLPSSCNAGRSAILRRTKAPY